MITRNFNSFVMRVKGTGNDFSRESDTDPLLQQSVPLESDFLRGKQRTRRVAGFARILAMSLHRGHLHFHGSHCYGSLASQILPLYRKTSTFYSFFISFFVITIRLRNIRFTRLSGKNGAIQDTQRTRRTLEIRKIPGTREIAETRKT